MRRPVLLPSVLLLVLLLSAALAFASAPGLYGRDLRPPADGIRPGAGAQPGTTNDQGQNRTEAFSIYLASSEEQAEAIREWALFADVMALAGEADMPALEKSNAFQAARRKFPDRPIDVIDMRSFSGSRIARFEPQGGFR